MYLKDDARKQIEYLYSKELLSTAVTTRCKGKGIGTQDSDAFAFHITPKQF